MPDTNPTPWPPAPPENEPLTVKKPINPAAGISSLTLALIAVFANITLSDVVFSFLLKSSMVRVPTFLFDVAWWGAAAALGIAGRQTAPGKTALVLLLLLALNFGWMLAHPAPRL